MKCSFCGKEIPLGRGKMIVLKNGKKLYFCSSKCEKNYLKLHRDPKKYRWARH